ncbi:hypothetical protein AAG906_008095 [Vitis piasezkii]
MADTSCRRSVQSARIWKYESNDECMAHYLAMVESCLEKMDEWVIRRVPREENEKVDALARITTHVSPSITPKPMCNTSQTNSGWMLSIMKYLQTREAYVAIAQADKLWHIALTRKGTIGPP